MADDKETKALAEEQGESKEFKEITVKMGKGLVGEPFQGKDGKDYRQIKIPNKDENDKSPWATFVVRANAVHDDQFGKGMWIKLPAEGTTTIRKDEVVGKDQMGKNVYISNKTKVPNTELKGMVEFYKNNDRSQSQETPKDAIEDKPKASLKDKVEKNKEKVAENKKAKAAEKMHDKAPKPKTKGQEI